MNELEGSPQDIETLLAPQTIRERCESIFQLAHKKQQTHFTVNLENLDAAVDYIYNVILDNYPSLDIPFHSRWGHFQVGKIDRISSFNQLNKDCDSKEIARRKFELAISSVLLDAGAGSEWKFYEKSSQSEFNRSEGLAVASFHMFLNGLFSSNPENALQVDARAIEQLQLNELESAFQISDQNKMLGLHGRYELLKSLSNVIREQKDYFTNDSPRLGQLFDYLQKNNPTKSLDAPQILHCIQKSLGSIWPGRVSINGFNLGDVWHYKPLGDSVEALVPFHKLSQWLSYSLIEPLMEAGFEVKSTNRLTGLAEYRNGGLFVDLEVLNLKDNSLFTQEHKPSSEIIIEWRALTIALLERVAPLIRKKLNKNENEFPLGKILEGGTWAAGRKIAKAKRQDASPPLKIISDGTVF